jgi:hypothetical protein
MKRVKSRNSIILTMIIMGLTLIALSLALLIDLCVVFKIMILLSNYLICVLIGAGVTFIDYELYNRRAL